MSMLVSEWAYEDDAVLNLVRNRLLTDLVTGGNGNGPIPKEKLTRWNVNSSYAFPTLAVFEPSGFGRGERGRRRYAEQIGDFLRREGPDASDVFVDEEGRVGLLFSWESKEAVEDIHARLRDRFELPINAGVGLPCGKLADAPLSYRQALLALDARFYKGVGRVVYYNETGNYRRLGEYPAAKEKELFERLRSEEELIVLEEAVDDFYEELLEEGPLDRRFIDESTIRLLIGLEKRACGEAYDDSAYRSCAGYDVLSVVQMETLQEIKEHVRAQLRKLREWMKPAPAESRHTIIKKTLEYLKQDFEFATLDNTARKVHMTPTYLSALFKNSTGKTFIEQLTDIRIEKAKDMLRGTHLKNYEVAEKVGYKDSRYFSQIFKKKVGLSPSEYRDLTAK